MIPRTLVPTDVRPLTADAAKNNGRRLTTYLDDRTVVPPELSDAPPLDGKSTIPSHLPLGVLVERTLVPRGMAAKPLENAQPRSEYASIAILDSRVVVPAYVEPAAPGEVQEFVDHPRQMTAGLREVVEPDIFTTGDANLLIEPEDKRDARSDAFTRTASVIVHIALIIFIIFIPNIFPAHVPTQSEIELARNQLGLTYLRPYSPSKPPGPAGPKVRIDNKTLNKVAPPRPESHAIEAPPAPAPERNDLPAAPTPHVPVNPNPQPSAPSAPAPSHLEPALPPVNPAQGKLNLQLPNASPGRAIQDQLQDAVKHSGGGGGNYEQGGSIPRGAGRGGGGGGPGVGNAVSILTPTEGVNFDSYITRMLAIIKRNWYAVMPESAYMGDKGMVNITFQINQDGSVQLPDPILERTSGKPPLDNAAMSAIKSSNPFDPLPSEFKGPYIRLRIIFLYNLPLDYAKAP
jgi:TonB family protein